MALITEYAYREMVIMFVLTSVIEGDSMVVCHVPTEISELNGYHLVSIAYGNGAHILAAAASKYTYIQSGNEPVELNELLLTLNTVP